MGVECDGAGCGGVIVLEGVSSVVAVVEVLMTMLIALELRGALLGMEDGRVGDFSLDEDDFLA